VGPRQWMPRFATGSPVEGGIRTLGPRVNGHRFETASCRFCQGTHSLNGSAFPHIREFGSSSPRQTGTAHFNRGETPSALIRVYDSASLSLERRALSGGLAEVSLPSARAVPSVKVRAPAFQ
jgi:hypothetical protein